MLDSNDITRYTDRWAALPAGAVLLGAGFLYKSLVDGTWTVALRSHTLVWAWLAVLLIVGMSIRLIAAWRRGNRMQPVMYGLMSGVLCGALAWGSLTLKTQFDSACVFPCDSYPYPDASLDCMFGFCLFLLGGVAALLVTLVSLEDLSR